MENPDTSKPVFLELLMSTALAASYLKISPRALEKWRLTGEGPVFVKVSPKCVRYRLQDLKEFVEKRLRKSTSETIQN